MEDDVLITSAARLPVGRFGGSLANADEIEMGSRVVREAIARSNITENDVDEVIVAYGYRTGKLPNNVARVIAVRAGIPIEVPSFTVNKACGGGLRAVTLAAQAIKAGDSDVIVAGGEENMSKAAYLLPSIRWGRRMGHDEIIDPLILFDPISKNTMGETAENIARKFSIGREEQDRFALESQRKALKAVESGIFKEEIVPIEVKGEKGNIFLFEKDESPRTGLTLEKLALLPPAFVKGGTVTAGNSCPMNDGAAAVVIMSGRRAASLGVKPLAKVLGYASSGVEPSLMGIGPIPATRLAIERAGISISDLDLIELNEAFASQAIYCIRELGFDPSKVNVNGGAIALGHPVSATGIVLLTKLLYEMKRRKSTFGLVTMCMGGGMGISMVVERITW